MRALFAILALVFCTTLVVPAEAAKATLITTELGEFPALVGKELPEFVKQAAENVPTRIVAELGSALVDRVVVVTDAQAFAKAMGIKDLHAICVEMTSKTVYVLLDRKLGRTDSEDPLMWVVRAEQEWQASRLRQVPDRGMLYLLAAMLAHEVEHVSRKSADEGASNERALELLDTFARQGKVSADLVRGYKAVLAANDHNIASR